MIQKKICMVGAPTVGKTSLVARYVKSIFSEKYLTTVGVKIDKKIVRVADQDVSLILWDLAGEDEFMQLQTSYLRGSAGYLLIVDGTRLSTMLKAITLHKKVEETVGKIPFILVINKLDLKDKWEVDDSAIKAPASNGWLVRETSAKSGHGVNSLFETLARIMMGEPADSLK